MTGSMKLGHVFPNNLVIHVMHHIHILRIQADKIWWKWTKQCVYYAQITESYEATISFFFPSGQVLSKIIQVILLTRQAMTQKPWENVDEYVQTYIHTKKHDIYLVAF